MAALYSAPTLSKKNGMVVMQQECAAGVRELFDQAARDYDRVESLLAFGPRASCAERTGGIPFSPGPLWSACGLPPLSSLAVVSDRAPPAAPGPRLQMKRKDAQAVAGR